MKSVGDLVLRHFGHGAGPSAELAALEAGLSTTVNEDSLNAVVQLALDRRKQGRIDQSIQLLTQANQAQLKAIEEIQSAIDALFQRPKRQVILAKFRQIYPFEMGIENGEDVLALLRSFAHQPPGGSDRWLARLHELEMRRGAEKERLAFFEERFLDGSEDGAIADIRQTIQAVDEELASLRLRTLDTVLATVAELLSKVDSGAEKDRQALVLSKTLFRLVTSPTATRHADDVRMDA